MMKFVKTNMCLIHLLQLSLLLYLDIQSTSAFTVTLRTVPSVVKVGQSAVLQCLYDLEGNKLYAVKFYRGSGEFYRYTPNDILKQRAFHIPKLHVDLSLSNGTHVTLRNLEVAIAGDFTCEVSLDEPMFSTMQVTTHLDVVALPSVGPSINTELSQYVPGDTMKAECTTGPSNPSSNLSFKINNEYVYLTVQNETEYPGGLSKPTLRVELPLGQRHFVDGRMTLSCFAQIKDIYKEAAHVVFSTAMDPVPQKRVTLAMNGARSMFSLNNAAFFVVLVMSLLLSVVQAFDLSYEDFLTEDFSSYDYFSDYNPDAEAGAITSLLGN